MIRLLFILIVCKKVYSYENDDAKYIDLLPEKEKQEFLERIARRILEGIQSRGTPKEGSIEITDDQLDEQTAYVQSIVKQEKDDLRKRRGNLGKYVEKEVTNVEQYSNDTDSGKRQKRTHDDETKYDIIPVQIIEDETKNNEQFANVGEAQDDIKNENYNNNEKDNRNTNYEHEVPLTSAESVISDTTAQATEIEAERDITTEDTTIIPTSSNIELENISDVQSTGKLESEITVSESDKTAEDTTIKYNNKNTGAPQLVPISNERKPRKSEEYDIDNNNTDKDVVVSKSNDQEKLTKISELKPNEITTTLTVSELNTNESTTNSVVNYKESPNLVFEKDVSGVSITKTYLRSLNEKYDIEKSADIEDLPQVKTNNNALEICPLTTVNSMKDVATETPKVFHNDDSISNDKDMEVSNKLHALRNNLELVSEEVEIQDSMGDDNENVKTKQYIVEEIPADKSPFKEVESSRNDQQSYYVPVYNYDTKNIFFDPSNRYEPSENDKNQEKTTDEMGRSRFGKRQWVKRDYDNIIQIPYQQPVFDYQRPRPKPQIYINPNDYFDMDYYVGRQNYNMKRNKESSSNFLPNSSEDDHQLNSINEYDLKNHIQAIRKLLLNRQNLKTLTKHSKQHKINAHNKDKKSNERDKPISFDYYFGRQQSRDDVEEFDEEIDDDLPRHKKIDFKHTERNEKNNIKSNVRHEDYNNALAEVLGDMIKDDREALVKYDWLGTTVDILAAIEKLIAVIEDLENDKPVHPSDLELLKYIVYLYKKAKHHLKDETKLDRDYPTVNIDRKFILPRNKNRNKGQRLNPLEFWKDIHRYIRNIEAIKDIKKKMQTLRELKKCLNDLRYNLNDLHNATKHIAIVTTHDTQQWYYDLKEIFLKGADKKQLLQVLLHLEAARLFSLIEESSKNGLEKNLRAYFKNNKSLVKNAKEEFLFMLRFLEELKK